MDRIFRVVGQLDWDTARESGVVPACGSDLRDGFIHLSVFEAVIDTANLYFEPDEQPLVLEVEVEKLGNDLRWEPVPSRDNQPFPHLYAPGIPLAAVCALHALHHRDDTFVLGARTAF